MGRAFTIVAQNFREIGPVRGRDGRSLRPGMLFRSGDLSEVTDACVEEMRGLGIRSVVDLRSAEERRTHPYDWLPAIDPAAWGDEAQRAAAAVMSLIRQAEASADDMVAGMCGLYRELPFSHAASYAVLFRRVAEGRAPVLFGCAAGKDRTGVAAALLLWSLGVDAGDIMTDYLLTNRNVERLRALAERKYGWQAGSPKTEIVLSAQPGFLEAAIDEVTARCGGIDGYVEQVLGLTPAERGRIEQELLG